MSFDCFDEAVLPFLSELKSNNNRAWFAENKLRYETVLKRPGQAFAHAMAQRLSRVFDMPYNAKVFRIHRDVRFSKDKTPYNAHLHMSFAADSDPGMWFFGLDPTRLSLGYGVFAFPKERLVSIREKLAGLEGAQLIRTTRSLTEAGLRVPDPALKRVPQGYDKDHPNAEALRRKGVAVWQDISEVRFATEPALADRTMESFRAFLPLRASLVSICGG